MVAFELLSALALAIAPVSAVWPVPTTSTVGTDTLYLTQNIPIRYNGEQISYTSGFEPTGPADSKKIVQGGVSRAFDTIFQQGLYPWKFHPRNESFEPDLMANGSVKSLTISQTSDDTEDTFKPLAGGVDESYNLSISKGGAATIEAVSSTGVLRALETFTQLFYTHSSQTHFYTPLAPVSISDSPKFPFRGIMLDTSRNFYPVQALLRTIDAAASAKLNIFIIHVTDAQSWPLEIPAIPELAEKGAYRPDLVYSVADVKKIQEYGVARGVEIIFEIDQPGHIASVGWSHPELLTALNAQPYTLYCAEPPCGQFKLNDSAVDVFLDTLMDDLLPRISPYSAYFHTGGDELKANDSALDPDLMTNDTKVLGPLVQAYTDKSHARVRNHGLTPLVWEEIPLEWNVTLGDDVIVQSWLGSASVKKIAEKGHKVIDSNYNALYLDCGRGQWVTFHNGPTFQESWGFQDWCGPAKNWEQIYAHDIIGANGLTEDEAELMLGGVAPLWSETADDSNVDGLLWPRAAVYGEVLWSGRYDADGRNRSQIEAAPRLNEWRERAVVRGVAAQPVQMTFCTEGGNCEQPYVPYP